MSVENKQGIFLNSQYMPMLNFPYNLSLRIWSITFYAEKFIYRKQLVVWINNFCSLQIHILLYCNCTFVFSYIIYHAIKNSDWENDTTDCEKNNNQDYSTHNALL